MVRRRDVSYVSIGRTWDSIIIKIIAYNWVQYHTMLHIIIIYNLIIIKVEINK